MLANLLARTHLKFVVIDKASPDRRPSRATGLQPRLLELLQRLGIKDEVLERAISLHGSRIFVDGKLTSTTSFFDPRTKSYALSLDQGILEGMLAGILKKRGGRVEWSKQLLGLKRHEKGWIANVTDSNCRSEKVAATIVVGCDGGRSKVRSVLDIAFPGETYSETAFISDCLVTSDLAPQFMHFFFTNSFRLVLVPFTQNRYKVSGGMQAKPFDAGLPLIRRMARDVYPGQLQFEAITDFRFYRMHARSAEAYSKSNVFLCGDAAHLFPPNGGQGLNLAVEDAFILGELLGHYCKTREEKSLQSYALRKTQIEEKLAQVKLTKSRYSYEALISQPIDEQQENKRVIKEEL